MLDDLTSATLNVNTLERELALVRFQRDDLILDLLGTKASRKDISVAAGLAEISIYKIAARVRERREKDAAVAAPVKKKTRAKKVTGPVQVELGDEILNVLPMPVIVPMPEGTHPLLGWTLAAA